MQTLKIMKPEELDEIFGIIHKITPLHEGNEKYYRNYCY